MRSSSGAASDFRLFPTWLWLTYPRVSSDVQVVILPEVRVPARRIRKAGFPEVSILACLDAGPCDAQDQRGLLP